MIDFTQDAHVHTSFSPDADPKAMFLSYVERAKAIGLKSIVFTDHVDFDAKHPLFKDMIDYDDYIKAFNEAKQASSIPIYLGVEVGYQSQVKDQINAFLAQYPFEFVILSVHYVKEQDLYTQAFFKKRTKEEAYALYFDQVLDAIQEIKQFDVIGHLDYITRYSPFGMYRHTSYQTKIDTILSALIDRNKGIEINTSGFATEDRMYPTKQIVDRFIELGGSKITIGSDAHQVSELGRYFDHVKTLI
jgi:histidinol-phosphatase (PHP family)